MADGGCGAALCPWGRGLGRDGAEAQQCVTQTPSFASAGCRGVKWCPEVSALVGRGGDARGTPGCGDPGGCLGGSGQCLRRAEKSQGCQEVHIQVMQGSGLAIWAWAALHWASLPISLESWTCPSSPPSFSLPTFSYIGDCEISVELQKIQAGVNGIQVGGARRDCLQVGGQGRGSGLPAGGGCSGGVDTKHRGWYQSRDSRPELTGPESGGWASPLRCSGQPHACLCSSKPPAREASTALGSERLSL